MKEQWLDNQFKNGVLVHPNGDQTRALDLYTAIAAACHAPDLDLTPAATEMAERFSQYDDILFVLVDGLGNSMRSSFPTGGFLKRNLASVLTSVYPSTTAVALTTLATLTWPATHGISGWWTYFPSLSRVIAPLLFEERGTGVGGKEIGLTVSDLIPVAPAAARFPGEVVSIVPAQFRRAAYNEWARAGRNALYYRNLAHAERVVARYYRSRRKPPWNSPSSSRRLRGYAYLYFPHVDTAAHHHGATSSAVASAIAEIDGLLGRLRSRLPESVGIVATADHGLIDVPRGLRYSLSDGDPLYRYLRVGPTAEATNPVFHVHEGEEQAFLDAFANHPASRHFRLFEPHVLGQRGLFGPGAFEPAAVRTYGTYVGVSAEPAILEYVNGADTATTHIGFHGGLRPQEMQVPLIIG